MLLKKNSKRNSRRNSRKNSKRNSRRNRIRRSRRNIKSANRRSNKIAKNRKIKNRKTKKIGGQVDYNDYLNNLITAAESAHNIEIDGPIYDGFDVKKKSRINFIRDHKLDIDQKYSGRLETNIKRFLGRKKKTKDIFIKIKKINEPIEEKGNRDFYIRNLDESKKNDRLKIRYSLEPDFKEEQVLNFKKIIFYDKSCNDKINCKIIFRQEGNTSEDKTVFMSKGYYKLFKAHFMVLNRYLNDFYDIEVIQN